MTDQTTDQDSQYRLITKPAFEKDPWDHDYYEFVDTADQELVPQGTLTERSNTTPHEDALWYVVDGSQAYLSRYNGSSWVQDLAVDGDAQPPEVHGSSSHDNTVPELDANGVVLSSQIPDLAVTETYTVADESERLNLDVQEGDIAIQTDEEQAYIFTGGDSTSNSNWSAIVSPPAPIDTVFGRTGDVSAQSGDYNYSQIDGSHGNEDHSSDYTTLSEVNNNADVPNADYADDAGDADTVDGEDSSAFANSGHDHSNDNIFPSSTNTDEIEVNNYEIFVQDTEPSNPNQGDIWIDNSEAFN